MADVRAITRGIGHETPIANLTTAIRRDRELRRAMEESGRDPFAEALQGVVPINRAMDVARREGRLAGIADFAKTGAMMRGGFGELQPPNLRGMAGRIAQKPQDIPDLEQVGHTAGTARAQTQGVTGPEYIRVARGAMKNYRRTEAGGLGARRAHVEALDRAATRLGPNATPGQLLAEIRKSIPKFSFDDLRNTQMNRRSADVRLDAPSLREGETVGEGIRSLAQNPEQLAQLKQAMTKLSPGEQRALIARIEGGGRGSYDTKAASRALKKLGYNERAHTRPAKPISGGSSEPPYIDQVYAEIERLLGGGTRQPTISRTPLTGAPKSTLENYLPVSEQFQETAGAGFPERLYHATGRTPGVVEEGTLKASTGYGLGLGGGSAPGVSFSGSLDEAVETARLLARSGRAVRGEIPVEAYDQALPLLDALRHVPSKALAKNDALTSAASLAEDINRLMGQDPILDSTLRSASSTKLAGIERLRAYYRAREAVDLKRDPYLALPDLPTPGPEEVVARIGRIRPEGVGIFEVPKRNLPRRTGFGYGDDPGEMRVRGDVPTAGGSLLRLNPRDLLGIAGTILGVKSMGDTHANR